MTRTKIYTIILSALFFVGPVTSLALIEPVQPDIEFGGTTGSFTTTSGNETSFRVCPGDTALNIPSGDDDYKVMNCAHEVYHCTTYKTNSTTLGRADCVETAQGYSWSCLSYWRDGHQHYANTIRCSIAKKKIPGKCSTTRNTCITGEVADIASSTLSHVWTCNGTGGGSSESCEEKIPQVVDGVCGKTKNLCTKGKLINAKETSKEWTWDCEGENKGKTVSCKETKPFKGVCGAANYACTEGTSIRQTKFTEKWTWACEGYGPSSVTSCSKDRVANGACSATTANKCDEGYASDLKTTATANTWTCLGVGGGSSASCSKNFSPQDGICSSSHYRCAKGTGVTPVASTNVWSWICPGLFGGRSVSCTESMGVKKGSCSVKRNECTVGTPSSFIEDDGGYKWTCIGPNSGGNASCEEKKKTEGVCAESQNVCVSGEVITKGETKTMISWICGGIAGGGSETCSIPKDPNASTTAVCSSKHYACNAGRTKDKLENSKEWTWTCDGNIGGKNASCSEQKKISSTDDDDDNDGNGSNASSTDPTKDDSCALNDIECLLKKCNGDKACEDALKKCPPLDIICINKALATVGKNATGLAGSDGDVCLPTDLKCLLKKCAGNLACENALKKCKKGDMKCINAGLQKSNRRFGPQFKENNGTCSEKIFACTYGTNFDNVRDIDSYKWRCLGKNGGYNTICKVDKPKDAVCSTKKHNTCDIGKPSKISETATLWNWTCLGVGGGKPSACSMDIVPLDGICIDEVKACSVGKSINYRLNGDWNEWVCAGAYGGSDTNCYKEVKGSCSTKRYTCASGIADAKSETSTEYSWKCRGANGDLTVSCAEKKPLSSSNSASSTASSSKQQ